MMVCESEMEEKKMGGREGSNKGRGYARGMEEKKMA